MERPVSAAADRGFIAKSERVLRAIEKVGVGVAGIMMFLIMLVVITDVVPRYFFNSPLSWSYEQDLRLFKDGGQKFWYGLLLAPWLFPDYFVSQLTFIVLE